jgi:exodeoxyribonuclease VII large subunit
VLRESGRGLTSIERAIRLVHPDRVIERGYVLVRSGGKLITRAGQLSAGDSATLTFRDGLARVSTIETQSDETKDDG